MTINIARAVCLQHHERKPTRKEGSQAGPEDMYIQDIARHLYQLQGRLEELERAHEAELPGDKRDELELELRKTRAEYQKVKNVLEGAKQSS